MIPICPLCGASVPVRRGEDVNAKVDKHIRDGCPKPFKLNVRVRASRSADGKSATRKRGRIQLESSSSSSQPPPVPPELRWMRSIDPDNVFGGSADATTAFDTGDPSLLSAQADRTANILTRIVTRPPQLQPTHGALGPPSETRKNKIASLARRHTEAFMAFRAEAAREGHWRGVLAALVRSYFLDWSTVILHARRRATRSTKRRAKTTQKTPLSRAVDIEKQLEPLFVPTCKCAASVAEAFVMNDLELAVWSLYLDKLQPDWATVKSAQDKLTALIFSAYTVKLLWSEIEDHQMFLPYLNRVLPGFTGKYKLWIQSKKKIKFGIPPLALAERYKLLQTDARRISNAYTHPPAPSR